MTPRTAVLLSLLLLPACRTYDYYGRVSDDAGLIPGDQYARYGREQAQRVAIARRFAQAREGVSADARQRQLEAAVEYARSLPDVAEAVADPQANWINVRFRSGWRTAVTPLDDGKRAEETRGLPAAGTPPATR